MLIVLIVTAVFLSIAFEVALQIAREGWPDGES